MLIGVTGKSCSGKNHICRKLASKGFEVWDLDREAEKIRKEKSDLVMAAFGTTDTIELRAIVFNNPQKRTELENIIYPVLTEKIKNFKYDLVINGATLHRSGLDGLCDFIIYVDASYEIRLERAKKRDSIDEIAFEAREKSQDDVDFRMVKYQCPVYILDNGGSKDSVISQDLDKILQSRQLF